MLGPLASLAASLAEAGRSELPDNLAALFRPMAGGPDPSTKSARATLRALGGVAPAKSPKQFVCLFLSLFATVFVCLVGWLFVCLFATVFFVCLFVLFVCFLCTDGLNTKPALNICFPWPSVGLLKSAWKGHVWLELLEESSVSHREPCLVDFRRGFLGSNGPIRTPGAAWFPWEAQSSRFAARLPGKVKAGAVKPFLLYASQAALTKSPPCSGPRPQILLPGSSYNSFCFLSFNKATATVGIVFFFEAMMVPDYAMIGRLAAT